MAKPIVLMVEDTDFGARLADLVQQAGYEPFFATDEAAIIQAMVRAPVLCIVDLGSSSFKWERLTRFVKGPGKKNNHVPVLGFGSDVDADLKSQAAAAGCTAVVEPAMLIDDLPGLIDRHIWRVNPDDCARPIPALVRQGIEEFNKGLYFECHETLEDAWNEEPGLIRLLYQGILQVAVGYLHINRQNWRGAVKVLERGIPKAAHFRPVCHGIDVEDVVVQAQRVRAELERLGPERIAEFDKSTFPKIRVDGDFPGGSSE